MTDTNHGFGTVLRTTAFEQALAKTDVDQRLRRVLAALAKSD